MDLKECLLMVRSSLKFKVSLHGLKMRGAGAGVVQGAGQRPFHLHTHTDNARTRGVEILKECLGSSLKQVCTV